MQTDARLGPVTREQRRPRPPEEPTGVEARPRRRDDERRPSDARPSDEGRREPRREVKRDAETPRERPVVATAPQAPVVATRTASAPAEELSVIGARPVSEKKKPKEKDKPKTAKEALRARAEQLRAQRPAKKANKNDKRDRGGPAEPEAEANVDSSTKRTAREESRPKERKVREESVAEPVAKKGVWQRIKGLFGGS